MPLPADWSGRLKLPAVAAPMFLISCPDLVVQVCCAGIVGTFPALNQRSNEGYGEWLVEIAERLHHLGDGSNRNIAPFGVNLIVHRSNKRLERDLATTVEHKVPLVITSLGAAKDVVDAVHSYGGVVFHDVVNLRHARKAVAAGVDGLVAVCAGAGGHGGLLNPLAFVAELRAFFGGTIALAGAISHGRQILATRALGADLAYIGTRFIATLESKAHRGHKEMILEAYAEDIIYTDVVSGVHANFLRRSVDAKGPTHLGTGSKMTTEIGDHEAKIWRDIWSAGQGVGSIHDIPPTAALCIRLAREYDEALAAFVAESGHR
jgi:nitronate monooxygenase